MRRVLLCVFLQTWKMFDYCLIIRSFDWYMVYDFNIYIDNNCYVRFYDVNLSCYS